MPTLEEKARGSTGQKYLLSVAAAMVAELVTFPLDLTKTRLQLQGEGGGAGLKRGMVATALGVVRQEGVTALWGGVGPGLARHAIYTGVRMELYDRLRKWAGASGELGLGQRAALGMTAGGFAQLVASPTDLVKVRLQMEGKRRAAGLPARQDTMLGVAAAVVKEGGFVALFVAVPCQMCSVQHWSTLATLPPTTKPRVTWCLLVGQPTVPSPIFSPPLQPAWLQPPWAPRRTW